MNDVAALATGFERALAGRGVESGPTRARAFAETLAVARPDALSDVYWLARIAMLPTIADLPRFNAAFLDFWNATVDSETLRALVQQAQGPAEPAQLKDRRARAPDAGADKAPERDARDAPYALAMASPDERLAERDFAEMDARDRAAARRAIAQLPFANDVRRSRRRRLDPRGDRLDVRATLRSAARTAGELVRPRRSARRERLRPIVFFCDVSGSMAPYARALLVYARANVARRARVRVFAFATRLTELTHVMRRTGTRGAVGDLARELPDLGSGTRIGAALFAFNRRHGQRGASRGGTVVVLSDGWERDDPELVEREMAHLRRLARRIVWVNPQKKHPAFEPLARGMAAALPHVDALVSGHNLRSLAAIAAAIELVDDPSGRSRGASDRVSRRRAAARAKPQQTEAGERG